MPDGTLDLVYAAPCKPSGRPLIVDSFAGGGGASTGIERALGVSPDLAINHDATALSMHCANHPKSRHLTANIWHVDPRDVIPTGREVGLAWFSPDCKHHSKAKGGKPVERHIRDLAWVVVMWAGRVKPRVIILENVEEFRDWCPLKDGRPDPDRRGETFDQWCAKLRKLGYRIEWRELRACDYGAPTIRKRLFVIARRDKEPIVWPEPTHGDPASEDVKSGRLKPWRTAAEIIDWSLPCPSIFDTSEEIMRKHGVRAKRPLRDNTLRRIARGVQRYVIDAKEPFFVSYAQQGGASRSGYAPHHTVTASHKDQNCIIAPTLVQTGYGERAGQAPRSLDMHKPIGTMVAGGAKHAVVAAFLAQHNAGPRNGSLSGRAADTPLSTLTTRGTQQQLVAAHMVSLRGTSEHQLAGLPVDAPVRTISAGGGHAGLVAAFLTKYYSADQDPRLTDPLHTVTTRDRFGLVTTEIDGTTYAITDIGMRMLSPREMFRAQGFDDSYIIDRGHDGRTLTKTDQVRMCGNSVCPPLAEALAAANCAFLKETANV